MTSFEDVLERGEPLIYRVTGYSMLPMLKENRDIVIIEKPESRLKKYDVALFRYEDHYVLHRVVRVKKDRYITRGDNNLNSETVPDGAVLGVLTSFVQDGRKISVSDDEYAAYYKKRLRLYPLRFIYRKLRGLSIRVKRALKGSSKV